MINLKFFGCTTKKWMLNSEELEKKLPIELFF